jgi:hypothetical protein
MVLQYLPWNGAKRVEASFFAEATADTLFAFIVPLPGEGFCKGR